MPPILPERAARAWRARSSGKRHGLGDATRDAADQPIARAAAARRPSSRIDVAARAAPSPIRQPSPIDRRAVDADALAELARRRRSAPGP